MGHKGQEEESKYLIIFDQSEGKNHQTFAKKRKKNHKFTKPLKVLVHFKPVPFCMRY